MGKIFKVECFKRPPDKRRGFPGYHLVVLSFTEGAAARICPSLKFNKKAAINEAIDAAIEELKRLKRA